MQKYFLCYNCDTEIIDGTQKRCPNCGVILHPNDYVKWSRSWYGFLCLLCTIPLVIAILLVYL